jgi:hypothetical protein
MRRLNFRFLVALALAVITPACYAIAAPKGESRDIDVGRKLFSFNLLSVPQSDWKTSDTACTNSGHRIFFRRVDSGSIGSIAWTFDPKAAQNFKITDCDGTFDGTAAVLVNERLSVYVMIRVVGKISDSLTIRCTEILDAGTDDLCLIDSETFNKSNSFTKIMSNVFDDAMENVLWSLETTTGFRNAQVWIFEKL